MKNLLISCVLVFSAAHAVAQKTLKDFDGELIFKESFYYTAITRHAWDTTHFYYDFSLFDNNWGFYIEKIDRGFFHEPYSDYETIRFETCGDSICLRQLEHSQADTAPVRIFPLNFGDTLESAFCYMLTLDSTTHETGYRYSLDCDGDWREYDTYRVKDTVILFKDYLLDCYAFEQAARTTTSGTIFRRRICLDKGRMIPVDVQEYDFRPRRTRFRNPLLGKNLLTYHFRLIAVE